VTGDREPGGEAVILLDAAVRALAGVQKAVRARKRAGREARLLEQLRAQAARSRAPEPAAEGGGDDDA